MLITIDKNFKGIEIINHPLFGESYLFNDNMSIDGDLIVSLDSRRRPDSHECKN